MEPAYSTSILYANYLNSLGLHLILMNGGTIPSQIETITMAAIAAAEIAVDAIRYPTRPAVNFTVSTNTANRLVLANQIITIPSHTTTPTFDRIVLVSGASATVGSTTGEMRYIDSVATMRTMVAAQSYPILLSLEYGGRLATFTP